MTRPATTSRTTRGTAAAAEHEPRRQRRLPVGAELLPSGGADFRVWAPRRHKVEVVLDPDAHGGRSRVLEPEADGYFSGRVDEAGPGTRYGFRLDGGEKVLPDPASRFQPEGPHGPSELIDPSTFEWNDRQWAGLGERGQVVYEMHVGTFTREGTWRAAARELPALADLGITIIEMMPIADFAGRFGWGYDGVDFYAPTRLYGRPDDLRAFVDAAHRLGLGVILDVVYNHFGPDGNYLGEFSSDYISTIHASEWGGSPNFDGENSRPVREFFVANAGYWIDEFHFDGLRLDATQQIFDDSAEHVLAEVTRKAEETAKGRATWITAENEVQDVRLIRPRDSGGFGITTIWNDDYHHEARVALTGRCEAYYTDYRGTPQEFLSAIRHGFIYQGQWYSWQTQRRGTPTRGIEPHRFVVYTQNHDQVANSGRGSRGAALGSPARWRALTALLLLGPNTPMLFQGQEYDAPQPFLYFADHESELADAVRRGRAEFLAQFPSYATAEVTARLANPGDPLTFQKCQLDHADRARRPGAWALHQDLLRLRREDPCLAKAAEVEGAVLGPHVFLLRWFDDRHGDRLLLVNLGSQHALSPMYEPLLAAPPGTDWTLQWSSEHPRYGGEGTPPPLLDHWLVPADSTALFRPGQRDTDIDERARPSHRTA